MSTDPQSDRTRGIRQLNDAFRRTFLGGRVLVTPGVGSLSPESNAELLERVRTFSDFDADNDPHHEHDFGAIDIAGERFFWKIDLYEEPDVKSENGEPVVTRVLTIMLADEY
jgi:hypothetical protein